MYWTLIWFVFESVPVPYILGECLAYFKDINGAEVTANDAFSKRKLKNTICRPKFMSQKTSAKGAFF